jgi:hypothetical protein
MLVSQVGVVLVLNACCIGGVGAERVLHRWCATEIGAGTQTGILHTISL